MTFSNDWAVTNNPADHSKFKEIPSFLRKIRTDLEERFAAIVYGFTSGETTAPGFKMLPLLNQGSDPSAPTDSFILFAKDASSVSELHSRHEVAGVKQLTLDGLLNLASTKIASEARGDMLRRGASGWERLAKGTSGQVLTMGANDPDWSTPAAAASQAEMEAASATDKYVSPGRAKYAPGVAKAWVKFKGSDATINASENIASVTRNSAGLCTIVWTTPFSSADYAVLITGKISSQYGIYSVVSQTASQIQIQTLGNYSSGGSNFDRTDFDSVYVVAYGDQ